jgi:hypothetical protein
LIAIAAVLIELFTPSNRWIIVIQTFNIYCYTFTLLFTLVATNRIMDPSRKASQPSSANTRDLSRQLHFAETKTTTLEHNTQDSSSLQTSDVTGRFSEKEQEDIDD